MSAKAYFEKLMTSHCHRYCYNIHDTASAHSGLTDTFYEAGGHGGDPEREAVGVIGARHGFLSLCEAATGRWRLPLVYQPGSKEIAA